MTGTLYIVATPIGNMDDITFRALQILKEVDVVLAEDSRKTGLLLKHYEIDKHILSYHQQSQINKKEEILKLLLDGKNLALVTDAGTPGVSDPGNELVDFLLLADSQIKIIPIPGASSVTAALSVCGFNVSEFLFLGFWPKKKTLKLMKRISELKSPVVFFESPYRVLKTLTKLEEVLGDKRVFVAQEVTKMHERTLRGKISEVTPELKKEAEELGRVKGELVVILEL